MKNDNNKLNNLWNIIFHVCVRQIILLLQLTNIVGAFVLKLKNDTQSGK